MRISLFLLCILLYPGSLYCQDKQSENQKDQKPVNVYLHIGGNIGMGGFDSKTIGNSLEEMDPNWLWSVRHLYRFPPSISIRTGFRNILQLEVIYGTARADLYGRTETTGYQWIGNYVYPIFDSEIVTPLRYKYLGYLAKINPVIPSWKKSSQLVAPFLICGLGFDQLYEKQEKLFQFEGSSAVIGIGISTIERIGEFDLSIRYHIIDFQNDPFAPESNNKVGGGFLIAAMGFYIGLGI